MAAVAAVQMDNVRPQQQTTSRRGIARKVGQDDRRKFEVIESISANDRSIDGAGKFFNKYFGLLRIATEAIEGALTVKNSTSLSVIGFNQRVDRNPWGRPYEEACKWYRAATDI